MALGFRSPELPAGTLNETLPEVPALANAANHDVVDDLLVDGATDLQEVDDPKQRSREALDLQDELRLDVAEERHLRRVGPVLDGRPI